jgi:hypothetical protein
VQRLRWLAIARHRHSKDETLMFYIETTAVYCKKYKKHINISCAKHAGLLHARPCSISYILLLAVFPTGFIWVTINKF